MNVIFRPLNYGTDWEWVRSHLPLQRCEGGTGILAYDEATDDVLAATVMESWTKTSVVTHIIVANPMVLRHGFLEECFWYVFQHADRLKMYGHVRSDNDKCLKLTDHMGFRVVAFLDDAYDVGVADVVLELHRDDCEFEWRRPVERRVANG